VAKTFTKSVSSISFPVGEYDDRFVELEQYSSKLEQEFCINNIEGLKGAKDVKINNYSSFFMSDKAKLTDFVSVSSLAANKSKSLTTKLSFTRPGAESNLYFYIFNTNGTSTTDAQKALGLLPLTEANTFVNNFFFEIEALDNNLCRIKHNNGLFDFYLNWNADDKGAFVFYQNTDDYKNIANERGDVFRYVLDSDGYIQLYKFDNDQLNVVTIEDGALTLKPFINGSLNRGASNLINVEYSLDENKQFTNNSFASYNTNKATNLILNTADTSTDDEGQYMFTTNYNAISSDKMPLNYFTLDSNRSEFNYIKRGSSMSDAPDGLPINSREYYGIYSGNDQEKGLEKLTLNYTFYDKDVFVQNGSDTFFTAPSSIYPFDKLNINDTAFVNNGAFAGPTPNLSDKIFIKRQNSTQFDNGRYLCTWLSGGNLDTAGLWVDRYYYPDKITKTAALSSEARYAPALNDSVDGSSLAVTNAVIAKEKFFDKKSDAAIEPNVRIKYQRIGNADIKEIVESSAPLVSAYDGYFTSKTVRGETESICNEFTGKDLTFDGTKYVKLNVHNSIDDAKAFTLNFDMHLDPDSKYGFELLGNNSNRGFGIFQDQSVTPFIHVVSGHTLYIYNTDFVLLNKVDFKTRIKNVFKRSALDDYIVSAAGNLFYKVNTQGNKIKLECGSEILDYYGFTQEHNHIDFINSAQTVQRFDVNTFETTTLTAAEFDVYENEFCLYDNVINFNDTAYKLPGEKTNWENSNTVFYQVSSYLVKHDLNSGPEAFMKAKDNIKDFVVVDDQVTVVTSDSYFVFNTSGVFNLSGSISSINIPSPVNSTVTLSGGSFISVDYVNEYIAGVQYKYPVFLAEGSDSNLYLAKGTLPSLQATALSGVTNDRNTGDVKLTNYNNLNHVYDSKSIDFKLSLKNYLNSEDNLTKTISFTPSAFEPGFYNFTYRLDTLQGNSSLYINGALYENQTFQPGKYQIQDIFSDELFIGSAGFQSNLDLATYLKQPNYYYCKDLIVRNPFVYDKAISTEQVYALYLSTKQVDDIVLSLPGGQRTSKTEIQQFFKFNRTNSSNLVDIVVRNLNMTDETTRGSIKASILSEASKFVPVGVKINDIKFVDYE
tara:strand:+ start:2297 stop:5623 length:3327 start_codon:yes stop_codon:yes gene_type:complete